MASEIRVNKIANRAGLSTVEYTDTGIIVSGIVTCTEISGLNALNIAGVSTFASPLDINGDIDVDGHTNLDNLSVAGVATFVGAIGGTFDVDGHTNLDNVNISGMTTTTGDLYLDGGKINVGTGVTIKASGEATYSGIVTASAFKLADGSNVGGVESDGSQNTVGGTNAGDSIVSGGTENTVFGYNAGTAISTGDNNTFFGSRAGRSISTGLQNTGVGYNVMGNTSGTGNAALGQSAGAAILGGSYNVALGWSALSNTNNNGNNNIVIGKLADISASNVSNEITLGNSDISHFRIPGIGVSFGRSGATIAGVVTATSFSGDGSSLSNLPAGAPVGGASTNTVFFENDKAVAVNYQITSTKNAMSAGPIAINAGIAVTVPSGCSWTIV